MNSEKEEENVEFEHSVFGFVLFSMRETSNADERMSERGNLHEQGSSALFAFLCWNLESAFFVVRCEAGSQIYNKFVANVFLPEMKKKKTRETKLIRLATRMKPVYSARERIRNENAISTEK